MARYLGIQVVVQLGDFGIWAEPETRNYLNRLEVMAARSNLVVYALAGNHENLDLLRRWELVPDLDGFVSLRPHVRWIPRGHRWQWGGVRFGALGGAFSLDWRGRLPGVTWWPGAEEVQPEDVERLSAAPLDVLLTHDAPLGAEPQPPFATIHPLEDEHRAWVSRRLLLDAIEATRPTLVLHGHWHHRNSQVIELPDCAVRVEGLASNLEGDASGKKHSAGKPGRPPWRRLGWPTSSRSGWSG